MKITISGCIVTRNHLFTNSFPNDKHQSYFQGHLYFGRVFGFLLKYATIQTGTDSLPIIYLPRNEWFEKPLEFIYIVMSQHYLFGCFCLHSHFDFSKWMREARGERFIGKRICCHSTDMFRILCTENYWNIVIVNWLHREKENMNPSNNPPTTLHVSMHYNDDDLLESPICYDLLNEKMKQKRKKKLNKSSLSCESVVIWYKISNLFPYYLLFALH